MSVYAGMGWGVSAYMHFFHPHLMFPVRRRNMYVTAILSFLSRRRLTHFIFSLTVRVACNFLHPFFYSRAVAHRWNVIIAVCGGTKSHIEWIYPPPNTLRKKKKEIRWFFVSFTRLFLSVYILLIHAFSHMFFFSIYCFLVWLIAQYHSFWQ